MKKLIFLISGKKHSGKTSLVESFVKVAPALFLNKDGVYPDWYTKPVSFAFGDELKKFCSEYFEIPLHLFYSEEGKNSCTKYQWKNIPPHNHEFKTLYENQYADLGYRDKIRFYHKFLTVRDFMQVVCNDVMGTIFPRIWINKTIKAIRESHSNIIFISDWRFLKEDDALIEQDDFHLIRIRLNRYIPQNPKNDNHISETNLDNYPKFDFLIKNQDMPLEESKRVFREVVTGFIEQYYSSI